jgi:iron complex outermembrane receptor protein
MAQAGLSARVAAAVLLAAGMYVGLAFAADSEGDGPVLQEVVVSAQKRDTKLQETPISISAVTGADLAAAGISDVQAIAQRTPGLAMSSAGPGRSVYNINGISSAAGSSSTVGFYLDDIPLTPATDGSQTARFFFDPDLFDVARVEVLRGPQGTLYGAGSMGGTIRIIANAPQLSQFSAAAAADGSDTSHGGTNWSANAMLNIPLSDWAALRIAASEKNYDGWIDRVVLNPFPVATSRTTRGNVLAAPVSHVSPDVNTEDLQAARIRLLIEPLSELKITLGFDYQHMSQGGYDTVDVPPGGQYYAHFAAFDTPEPAFDQSKVFSANLQYSFENVQLISTSALVERDSRQAEETGEDYNFLFGGIGAPLLPTKIINTHSNRQFSEEARLVSTGDGPLRYVAGVFYETFDNTFNNNSVVPEYLALFGTDKVAVSHLREHLKQVAGFGEVSYRFLEHWTATGGLRWYHFTDADYTNTGLSLTAAPPPLNVQNQNASGGAWLPKVSVSYEPSKELLTYFTYSQGSRIGGNNINVPTTGANTCVPFLDALGLTQVPPTYEGDSVKSFELGAKSTLLSGRVTMNASVFYINWDKVQQEAILGCGYPLTLNEGTAVSKGGNLELNAQVSAAVHAGMSTGYTKATVGQTIPGIVTAGEQLQDVPKFTHSAWLDLEQPLSSRLSLIGRVSNSYYGASRDTGYKPAYDLLSWRLGIASEKTWSAEVYMDNVTNRIAYLSNTISLAANIPTLDRVATNRPRTTGIALKYQF